ncbi:MAG: hypothetical protein HC800_15255 [Phormidesmis sp. RL_2_1]|nr:hypothetical protein [Phormidesmis sp. RL_2_1]
MVEQAGNGLLNCSRLDGSFPHCGPEHYGPQHRGPQHRGPQHRGPQRWRLRWLAMMAASALTSLGTLTVPITPAVAAELTEWDYDSQTRSLNLVLPASIMPSVSVIAPNQLLLEIPDTQIGDIAGQNVSDGVVESIVLTQPTPETVWMVVEFVPGTVLAESQQVTPMVVADELPNLSAAQATQQWQLRPVLLARTSPSTAEASMAEEPSMAEKPSVAATMTVTPTGASDLGDLPSLGASAESLQVEPPTSQVAQAPDFPDLPVLAPAVPWTDESVTVPSASPSVTVPSITSTAPAASTPTVPMPEATPEPPPPAELPVEASAEAALIEDLSSQATPVVATPPVAPPVAEAPAPDQPVPDQAVAASPDQAATADPGADAEMPLEPPFLGDLGGSPSPSPSVFPEPPVVVNESEPAVTAVAPDQPELPVVSAATASSVLSAGDMAAASAIPTDENTTAPPVAVPGTAPVLDINTPDERVTPANASRWPTPIPFGQPLP